MSGKTRFFVSGVMFLALSTFSTAVCAGDLAGKALVNDYCTACHEQTDNGGLARISQVRKTPEGWDMTLFRMERLHGLEVDGDERLAIITYLSAEHGLAPKESAPFRYALENRAYFVDRAPNEDLDALCGRCHTNARYGLQRRTAGDWLKHMHFHVGQFPSLEYQARSRDRHWWQEVTSKTYKELAELYPFQNAGWEAWKAADHKSPVGQWRVVGSRPGLGRYEGVMTVSQDGDYFKADYDLHNMDGTAITGDSKSVVYTGYEWRGSGVLNGTDIREVYALSEEGNHMVGRWYDAEHYDVGGEFKAVRRDGAEGQVMTQSSDFMRLGSRKEITLYGLGLTGKISSGKGLSFKVVAQNDTSVTLALSADESLDPGRYRVTVGQVSADIILYDRIDKVKIYPAWTIARLGGGKTAPVTAQFEAIAYMKDKNGGDDIKIGIMAAQWQALPFNEDAAEMKDADFSGHINQQGTFMPASAGPNPHRKYSTDNAGNLSIVGRIKDGDRDVTGKAQLIVTVQRWNLPPIR